MQNIHEILKAYAVEIPVNKKVDFDRVVAENYKTIAEVNKINEKLTSKQKRRDVFPENVPSLLSKKRFGVLFGRKG